LRRFAVLAAVMSAALSFGIASVASANTYSVDAWELHSTYTTTYGSYTVNDLNQRFRWRVDMAHSVDVRTERCDGFHASSYMTIPAHDQTYRQFVGSQDTGTCMRLRGQSNFGGQTGYGYLLA
jgi:hypothetical protein